MVRPDTADCACYATLPNKRSVELWDTFNLRFGHDQPIIGRINAIQLDGTNTWDSSHVLYP